MVCSNFIIALPQCEIEVIQINDPRELSHISGLTGQTLQQPEAFVEALADGQDEGLIWMGFEKGFEVVDVNQRDYFEKVRVRFKSSECCHAM